MRPPAGSRILGVRRLAHHRRSPPPARELAVLMMWIDLRRPTMETCISQAGDTHAVLRSAPEPGLFLCTNGAQIMPGRLFRDRRDAGRFLAGLLEKYRGRPDVIVLGLPRGGVPVVHEVATALGAPPDVFLVRKLGAPGQEELAMGAIASALGRGRDTGDVSVRGVTTATPRR
jgi:Phosphoribosyl transferase domain